MKVWFTREEPAAWIDEGRPETSECVSRSMGVWALRYGDSAGRTNHIVALFGAVPYTAGALWLWAEFFRRDFPLLAAARAWREFTRDLPYALYAHACGGRDTRFLAALGFTTVGQTGDDLYMERLP